MQPKTVNAFQRVKVEEVEFIDERLKDNSYWAKVNRRNIVFLFFFCSILLPCFLSLSDFHNHCLMQDGAETGYGAKAQGVLGQVRGRCVILCINCLFCRIGDKWFMSFEFQLGSCDLALIYFEFNFGLVEPLVPNLSQYQSNSIESNAQRLHSCAHDRLLCLCL